MRFLRRHGVLLLAVVFIGYHLVGSVMGIISFAQLVLNQNRSTPQVESTTGQDFEASEVRIEQVDESR